MSEKLEKRIEDLEKEISELKNRVLNMQLMAENCKYISWPIYPQPNFPLLYRYIPYTGDTIYFPNSAGTGPIYG